MTVSRSRLSIPNTGVNTSKLYRMEQFVDSFPDKEAHMTGEEIHKCLDQIEEIHALYSPKTLGLAAAHCLLWISPSFWAVVIPEMLFAFVAAGIGNALRTKLIKHHFTLFSECGSVCIHVPVWSMQSPAESSRAGIPYLRFCMKPDISVPMLFIIPGFPFITSGIDLAKLDLRSGLERLTYSIIIVLVATMFAWIMALILKLQPVDFLAIHLEYQRSMLVFRLLASFCGVFGFSIMFNSPVPMAATAATDRCARQHASSGAG